MKRYLITAAILCVAVPAHAEHKLAICHNQAYALCASSGTVPTTESMTINGRSYRVGISECPVIVGDSVADLNLMNGSCNSPDGTDKTVWSLFGIPDGGYPQPPTYVVNPSPTPRTFTVGKDVFKGDGMSNQWSYPCTILPKKQGPNKDVTVAACRGPLMENPTNKPVYPGMTVGTQGVDGMPNPVGGAF